AGGEPVRAVHAAARDRAAAARRAGVCRHALRERPRDLDPQRQPGDGSADPDPGRAAGARGGGLPAGDLRGHPRRDGHRRPRRSGLRSSRRAGALVPWPVRRRGSVSPCPSGQARAGRGAGNGYSVSCDSSPGRTGPLEIVISRMWRTGENQTTAIETKAPTRPMANAVRRPRFSATTPPTITPARVIRVVNVKHVALTRPMTRLSAETWTRDVSTIS